MSDFKQYTGFDGVSVNTSRTLDFKDALKPIAVEMPSATANDVLQAVDQLRRELSGYHGQLKAHNDLQRHCDNQRERISELEGIYAKAKAERDENAMSFSKEHDRAEFLARENARLRRLCRSFAEYTSQDRCEGCACKSRCNDGEIDECWMLAEVREIASELGMEVDG